MIKCIVFDLDDTLYDSHSCHRAGISAVQSYVLEKGICTDLSKWNAVYQEQFDWQFSFNGKDSSCHNRGIRFQRMLEALGKPISEAATLECLYWGGFIESITPFGNIGETFKTLKSLGLRLGIGTNMTAHWQLRKIERLGLSEWVDFAVTSEEACAEKPDPAFFGLVAEKSRCAAADCMFVGDNLAYDYTGSRACGFRGIWMQPDSGKRAQQPDVESIASISDLITVVSSGR